MTGGDRDVLSREEFEAALLAPSEEEKIRLRSIAKWWTAWTSFHWEDLLQEAVFRGFRGTRKCPRHVPIIPFLDQVMRSIKSEWTGADLPLASEPYSDDELEIPLTASEPVDEKLVVRVRLHLQSDQDALVFLDGLLSEMERAEFVEHYNWTITRYETTRRRFNRKLAELGQQLKTPSNRTVH